MLPLLALACLQTPVEPAKSDAKKAEGAAPQVVDPPKPLTAETDEGLKPTTEPLTAEEQRLIAADPKTLSPEEMRLRGHALRKKIMMNPESDSAKALQDARAAALAGTVDPTAAQVSEAGSEAKPQGEGLVLQAPPHLMKPEPKADEAPTK